MESRLARWGWWEELCSKPTARRSFYALLLLTFLGSGVTYFQKVSKGKSALRRWLPQIAELQEGKNIFLPPPEGYTYPHPPFAAVNLIPYANLPMGVAVGVWHTMKWGAFLLSLLLIFSTIQERGHAFSPFAKLIVLLLSVRTAVSDMQHGNINLFILFWCCLAFYGFRRQQNAVAGLAVAVGISLKVTPGLILAYFAYKRAWRACFWVAIGLIVCNLFIPALFFGFDKTVTYSVSWFDGMVRPHIIEGHIETDVRNQSMQAVVIRLLTSPSGAGNESPGLMELSPDVAVGIVRALLIGLLLLLAFVCRTATSPRENFFLALEFSLVLLAMLYLNERSWKHHYVLTAYPYAAWIYCIRRAIDAGAGQELLRPFRWIVALIVSVAVVYLSSPAFLGDAVDVVESYGTMFFASVILFFGLAHLVLRARKKGWTRLEDALHSAERGMRSAE